MISIVIPTRNRAYTLEKVLTTYYIQKHVDEIIIVDDCGHDNTKDLVEKISNENPKIETRYFRHEKVKGAAAGRVTGCFYAKNEFVLFGEDDLFLEENYTEILFEKFAVYEKLGNGKIGIVSGRIIYKLFDETNCEALKRFGYGFEDKEVFNNVHFGLNVNAIFSNDIELPLTHAIFLARKDLLNAYGFDEYYCAGNGYREESDLQMNLFVNDFKIICTNDTHCFHMSRQEVYRGGQRVNRLKQFYWSIYFTNYFYKKYFDRFRKKLGLSYGRNVAIVLFAFSMFNILFVLPLKKVPDHFFRVIKARYFSNKR